MSSQNQRQSRAKTSLKQPRASRKRAASAPEARQGLAGAAESEPEASRKRSGGEPKRSRGDSTGHKFTTNYNKLQQQTPEPERDRNGPEEARQDGYNKLQQLQQQDF